MKSQILAGVIAAAMLPAIIVPSSQTSADSSGMRDITTMELVRDMGIGINLGNTMEAAGDWIAQWGDGTVRSYETAWGSPEITQDMINGYASEGFGVLRIPVAWSNLMGENYKISSDYMARVQQLVTWTIDADMYAIINIHWDNGWVNKFPENKDESMKRYTSMWEQICEGFKDYDDHLMFESQNEELGWESMWNRWGGPSDKEGSYALVNEINQKFVDTVRSSGGNNPKRHLLISGYNTGIDTTCDPLFKMPSDPAGRCAVSVHYYTPASFAILEEDADWAKMRPSWGTSDDFRELNKQMDMMKTSFIDKGIPVIIGEYGCPIKNKDLESVQLYLSSVCKAAYERHLCPVMWDTPGGHYDREAGKMTDQTLMAQLRSYLDPKPEPVTDPTASTEPPEEIKWGDADCDGQVKMNDAVLIMQSLSNPDRYGIDGSDDGHITEKGKRNANVYENVTSSITPQDALAVQQYLLKIIASLEPAKA
ncbi:MAG: cellulase family glycosylhydrolase [Ruminococcus sp.]|nr:cellulase family glycosylhydrolase [Ruminococcus sp.]